MKILSTLLILQTYFACATESITGLDQPYREMCLKASIDPYYFERFRSLIDYSHALEIEHSAPFIDFLFKHGSKEIFAKSGYLQKLDKIGNPPTKFFLNLGKFSATTLRYIVIADHLKKLFSLPKDTTVVEIGAGFGGQCFILSQLQPFFHYYIYDLPEPQALIDKVLSTLEVENVTLLPLESELPGDSADLVISNYAFSECSRSIQLNYFDKILKKAKRGYMIYNQTSHLFGVDSLSPEEVVTLLQENNMNPMVHEELIPTAPGNLLITWDTTNI